MLTGGSRRHTAAEGAGQRNPKGRATTRASCPPDRRREVDLRTGGRGAAAFYMKWERPPHEVHSKKTKQNARLRRTRDLFFPTRAPSVIWFFPTRAPSVHESNDN